MIATPSAVDPAHRPRGRAWRNDAPESAVVGSIGHRHAIPSAHDRGAAHRTAIAMAGR